MSSFSSKWLQNTPETPKYRGLKSGKRASETFATPIEQRSDAPDLPPFPDRPPATEQELRRLMDHLADDERFGLWLEDLDQRGESVLLNRLQKGQGWLLHQHERWLSGNPTAADDAEFSRLWNIWLEIDVRLRSDYGFQRCIHGPSGKCPDGFRCIGCLAAPEPVLVAQLALLDAR